MIGTFKNHPNGRSGRHEVELKIIRFQPKTHKSSSIGPQDVDWKPGDNPYIAWSQEIHHVASVVTFAKTWTQTITAYHVLANVATKPCNIQAKALRLIVRSSYLCGVAIGK
ncbi:MAG TPA: hypothetical protein DCF63_10885 [Planctomycetaceae bacterium]|nr:hypothetical protein [Planctomycetaceae bacterium]